MSDKKQGDHDANSMFTRRPYFLRYRTEGGRVAYANTFAIGSIIWDDHLGRWEIYAASDGNYFGQATDDDMNTMLGVPMDEDA